MGDSARSDLRRISRVVAHALRHAPGSYGLRLDATGAVPVEDLLSALRARRSEWRSLRASDLAELVAQPGKQRFEIDGDRIRARYGHSAADVEPPPASAPPELLLHGTHPGAVAAILRGGLRGMSRKFVHLSQTRELAREVALRRTRQPVILTVLAQRAASAGLSFHPVGDGIWLCAALPPEFLRAD